MLDYRTFSAANQIRSAWEQQGEPAKPRVSLRRNLPPVAGKKPDRNAPSKFRLAGMGLELAGAVIGGCAIGCYIDWKFDTRYGLMTGALVGIVGGMYNLLKQALKTIKDEQKRIDESKDAVDGDH